MREEEHRCLWFTHTPVPFVLDEKMRRRKKERKEVQVSGGHRPFFSRHARKQHVPSPTHGWLARRRRRRIKTLPGTTEQTGPRSFKSPFVSHVYLSQPADLSSQQQQQQSHHRPTNFSGQAKYKTGPSQARHSSNKTTNSTIPTGMFTWNHTHLSRGLKSKKGRT